MKTKEIIRQLQELDPSGEEEVVVGHTDINFIERLPVWYDGFPEILIKDKDGYVIGAKIKCDGDKIKIHLISIEDAMYDCPSLPVDISGDKRHKDWLIGLRKEVIAFYEDHIKNHPDTPNMDFYKEAIKESSLEIDILEEKSLFSRIVNATKKIWKNK